VISKKKVFFKIRLSIFFIKVFKTLVGTFTCKETGRYDDPEFCDIYHLCSLDGTLFLEFMKIKI
jgi:hypothetical protein